MIRIGGPKPNAAALPKPKVGISIIQQAAALSGDPTGEVRYSGGELDFQMARIMVR